MGNRPPRTDAGRTAIAGDDDHGREQERVVQAGGLRWPELLTLAEVVAPALGSGRHMVANAYHPGCRECVAIQAHRRLTGYTRYRTVGPDTPPA